MACETTLVARTVYYGSSCGGIALGSARESAGSSAREDPVLAQPSPLIHDPSVIVAVAIGVLIVSPGDVFALSVFAFVVVVMVVVVVS